MTARDAADRPRRRRASAFIAAIAAVALLVSGSIAVTERPAYAVDYPSWDDVLDARRDVARAQAKIKEIRAAIAAITAEVERTQAIAQEKGDIYYEAQLAFDEAAFTADQLQAQADEAQARADESRSRAGQFVAELARSGGGDLSASLFTNPGNADELLSRLGFASKITEQAEGIYAAALQDQNAAQSLTDQANVAKEIRDELRLEAQAAFEAAQVAAEAAQNALIAQQENQARLEAQLDVLIKNRAATEKDYRAGIAAQYGSGSSLGAGQIKNGWAVPTNGYISSGYGYRVHPISGAVRFHAGVDIANAAGTPIYAAASGVVEYAGWSGGFGNYIRINHGNGLTTGYPHLQNGGILVRLGQEIVVGQNIGRMGTTGYSTGNHLHFEVRQNGVATNPVTYLRNKGLTIG
ncbi:peptidoglycan DD-metalloendopeptidase family protein [Microcella humidisoli]|uniref:Peptidoglycan DD-metalloendopeptidase family protein n=1 Tax=Microcella humidisoli TaxID=2963406 RepID=A0ABY5FY72_9MICO|nr:M23 family metallopeptidase [Microcella humidisoli]UTT63239.1 peptidoglycan DD-metalloendopeptidase family protein [Microcella humidisoli]